MRKTLLGTAVLALGVLLSGCAGGGGTSSGSGKPVLVGVSLSLDGDFSGDGKALQQGYQLWADDVNAKGGLLGRKVQFKFVNDASSTQQVVTNYTNLITRDKVDLTFGPFSSLLTIPSSQIAARYSYAFPEPAGEGEAAPPIGRMGEAYMRSVDRNRRRTAINFLMSWTLNFLAGSLIAASASAASTVRIHFAGACRAR